MHGDRVTCEFCGEDRPAGAQFCRCGAAVVRRRWRSPRRVHREDVIIGYLLLLAIAAAIEVAIVGIVLGVGALLRAVG